MTSARSQSRATDILGNARGVKTPSDQRLVDFRGLAWNSAKPIIGAGNETRTRDLNLGKVALYQLSYSRMVQLSDSNLDNVFR